MGDFGDLRRSAEGAQLLVIESAKARPLVILALLLAAGAPVSAQEAKNEALEPDSSSVEKADSIRANMDRPPPRPPAARSTDLWDVVAYPIELLGTPLDYLVEGVEVVGMPPMETGQRFIALAAEQGVLIGFGSLDHRGGPALEVGIERFSPFFIESAVSMRRSQRYAGGLRFGDPESTGGVIFGAFERSTEPHFWGIGPGSVEANRSDFLWDQTQVALEGSIVTRGGLRLAGSAGAEDNRIGRGWDDGQPDVTQTFSGDLPFGVDERLRWARFGLTVELDRTSFGEYQERGFKLSATPEVFRGIDGTESDFHKLRGEANAFVPITVRHQLAFRAFAETNRADDGPAVPFYYLAAVGSTDGLRGRKSDRFRDRDAVAVMSEYRYEIWRDDPAAADMFLFYDQGTVARSLSDVSLFDDLEQNYGFGLRLVKNEEFLGEAFLAFGGDGTRFSFKLGSTY